MKITNLTLFSIFCLAAIALAMPAFAAQPPTANAGPDLYVASGQTVTLQGSGYDPQGYSLTYYWNCNGGNLSSYTIAQPVYTAPSSSSQTNYVCTLTVTNSAALSASDSVNININSQQTGQNNVQTYSATNISNSQATLNGYFSMPYLYSGTSYVWFQWGIGTNYGYETVHQSISGNSQNFSQNIVNLAPNTAFHFRAVMQNNNGTFYGQDMTFNSNGSNNYYGNGSLSVTKQAINLTLGNLNWQSSVSANPGDILSFAIILQASGQDVHNVVVRDLLPLNLTFAGNLAVNSSLNYPGDIQNGVNVGTVPANGVVVVSYQARVAPSASLPYGASTLTSNATVTSQESGTQTASAQILMNNSYVYGNSNITNLSTGLTNNPVTDSFFLPIMLIILGSWFYFSGNIYKFSDWLGARL